MKITTVLFDLDGTLLPMDQEEFVRSYFGGISKKVAPLGYEPKALIENIWKGTSAMVKNDGGRPNEQAFWDCFVGAYGEKTLEDKSKFDEYYRNEFEAVRAACGYTPAARELVNKLKTIGYRVALATNPIFPAVATRARIRWAGLEPEDFEYYTTYENSSYCKPNPKYYIELVEKLGVDPHECLMIGNDVTEDMIAGELGMQTFLLTDCIINKENKDISVYNHGNFDKLLSMF